MVNKTRPKKLMLVKYKFEINLVMFLDLQINTLHVVQQSFSFDQKVPKERKYVYTYKRFDQCPGGENIESGI